MRPRPIRKLNTTSLKKINQIFIKVQLNFYNLTLIFKINIILIQIQTRDYNLMPICRQYDIEGHVTLKMVEKLWVKFSILLKIGAYSGYFK